MSIVKPQPRRPDLTGQLVLLRQQLCATKLGEGLRLVRFAQSPNPRHSRRSSTMNPLTPRHSKLKRSHKAKTEHKFDTREKLTM